MPLRQASICCEKGKRLVFNPRGQPVCSGEATIAGASANAWTADGDEMTEDTGYYMVPGEQITVVVQGGSTAATIASGNVFAVSINNATNSSVSANADTAFTVKTGASANKDAETKRDAASKSVKITGSKANDTVEGGKITFTITVGDAGDNALRIKVSNS